MNQGSFLTDPIGYLFGSGGLFQKNTPQSVGGAPQNSTISSINTTTVIGYVIAGGVVIYLARKVFVK